MSQISLRMLNKKRKNGKINLIKLLVAQCSFDSYEIQQWDIHTAQTLTTHIINMYQCIVQCQIKINRSMWRNGLNAWITRYIYSMKVWRNHENYNPKYSCGSLEQINAYILRYKESPLCILAFFRSPFFFRLHYTQIFTLLALTNEKKLNMYIQTMYTKVSPSLQNEEYAERFGNIVLEYIVFVCIN